MTITKIKRKETPLFFQSNGANLFGFIHKSTSEDSGLGLVMVHPPFEEKLWAHRIFVNMARYLADQGINVFRFDFFGHGDSEGQFENSSFSVWYDNLRDSIQFLKERTKVKRVVILGLRLAASVAFEFALKNDDVLDKLVLWEPVINGSDYLNQVLRINLTSQMMLNKKVKHSREHLINDLRENKPANIEGYLLGKELYEDIEQLDMSKYQNIPKQSLIIKMTPNLVKAKDAKIENMVASFGEKAQIEFARAHKFWADGVKYDDKPADLFEKTVAWILGRHQIWKR